MTIEWLDEERFRVGDLVFRYTQDYTAVTTDEEVIILKERPFVEFYIALLERERPKHLLEVGFYEGGSALLWAMLFPASPQSIFARSIRQSSDSRRDFPI